MFHIIVFFDFFFICPDLILLVFFYLIYICYMYIYYITINYIFIFSNYFTIFDFYFNIKIYILYLQNFTSPRNDPNSNPGGSSDISVYYNPDMVKDPWANLKPIPAKKTSFRSTQQYEYSSIIIWCSSQIVFA